PATGPLGRDQDVRHDSPMRDREPLACAAEASHYLISYEQDVVLRANLANALEIAGRSGNAAHRRTDHRLSNETRHVLCALPAQRPLQLVRAAHAAGSAVLTAIGVRRRNLRHVVDHRLVRSAAPGVATKAGGAERHAVEALPATDHQV